jgi:hypothetical protein
VDGEYLYPGLEPHTIISLPVQMAVWSESPLGASAVKTHFPPADATIGKPRVPRSATSRVDLMAGSLLVFGNEHRARQTTMFTYFPDPVLSVTDLRKPNGGG